MTTKKWAFNEFRMPDIWYDNDDEIYNLLQPFKRPRDIDPSGYDNKINFWENVIIKHCRHYHNVVINEKLIKESFTRYFPSTGLTQPLMCTSQIFDRLLSTRKITSTDDYISCTVIKKIAKGVGWMITTPVYWSVKKLYSFYSSETESYEVNYNSNYIVTEILFDSSKKFMNWIILMDELFISPNIKVMEKSDFDNLFSSFFPNELSRNVVLYHLEKTGELEIISLNGTSNKLEVVRFGNDKLIKDKEELMRGLIELKRQCNVLESGMEVLSKRLNATKSKALELLSSGRKSEALKTFALGKRIEQELDRRYKGLENLAAMRLELEGAEQNGAVVKGLKEAVKSLKATQSPIDDVKDIMADIEDAVADAEEINASLSGANLGVGDIDDLEKELEHLLMDENDVKTDELLSNLPQVPSYIPIPNQPQAKLTESTKKTPQILFE